jgi:hypothetical protein
MYKKKYAVFGHFRHSLEPYSEYIYDYNIVYAREQFKEKYPKIVIDSVRVTKGLI